jgi:hypothetical protein
MLWSQVIEQGLFVNRDIMFESGETAARGNIKTVRMEGDLVIFQLKWVYVCFEETPWTPSLDADRLIHLKLEAGENRLHYSPHKEHVYAEVDENEVPIIIVTIFEYTNQLPAPR